MRPVKPSPSSSMTPFSLFDDDLLNRTFARVGLDSRRPVHLAGRCLAVISLTWVPMAGLALIQHLYGSGIDARNFFADYAAYAQFLIALPLFIVGERIVSRSTREAAREFLDTGIISATDVGVVEASHRNVRHLRLSWLPDLACIGIAYALAAATIFSELFAGSIRTWHTGAGDSATGQIFTIFGSRCPAHGRCWWRCRS